MICSETERRPVGSDCSRQAKEQHKRGVAKGGHGKRVWMLFTWEMSIWFEVRVLDLISTFAVSKETRIRRRQQWLQRDQKGGWYSNERKR